MPDTYLMVDLETMDTAPSAAIVGLGACIFDPRSDTIADSYGCTISLEDNIKNKRTMSAGTVLWWLQQSQAARDALVTDPVSLRNALIGLRNLCEKHQPTRFWANDPDFDYVILGNAYESLDFIVPWKFWATRSVRTIKELAHPNGDFPDFIGEGTAHNAMDDAIKQAVGVQYGYAKLGV